MVRLLPWELLQGYWQHPCVLQLEMMISGHKTIGAGRDIPMTCIGLRSHVGMLCTRFSGLAHAGTAELPPVKVLSSASTTI